MENTKSSTIEGKNVGKKCRTHYRGTFNDGTQFDSSYDRGEPLEFVCGAGMMIKGFDAAVANMEVGQTLDVHLMPEEAYGLADPDAIFMVELAQLPGAEELEAGQQVYLQNAAGQPFPVKVLEKEEKLQQVVDYMEELKDQFSDLIQEYEDDGADVRKVDTLTEALDALEDAYEMVCEVAEEEE